MSSFFAWFDEWKILFEGFVFGYFVVLNGIYLVLTVIASVEFSRYFRRAGFAGNEDIFANPLTPSASVVVAAHNERPCIVETVHALLGLRYPDFEVIVVDDGSTDGTFEVLHETFQLVPHYREPFVRNLKVRGEVLSTYRSVANDALFVVRKESVGARADALNAGILYARKDLVCMSDADSIFDPEALLRVARPFVDDPERVVGSGGVIRPSNGCRVDRGTLAEARMPGSFLARVQVVEYLRSFMVGRTGWSALRSILIISGAFGVYRRDLLLELGGLDSYSLAEDAELVARIHRHFRRGGTSGEWGESRNLAPIRKPKEYRVVFVTEPVCWTEVPETLSVLGRQRRRWSRGLAEVLWKYRRMMANPRYGRIGLLVLPYYLVFELLGPVVELLGLLTMVAFLGIWGFQAVNGDPGSVQTLQSMGMLALFAMGLGVLLSLAALVVEEYSFHRMQRWRDLIASLSAAILENVGFRQLHSWWRFRGLIQWLRGGKAEWGVMTRKGFAKADP